MRIFLDSPSLVKLYHEESGTKELDLVFTNDQLLNEICDMEGFQTNAS